MSSVKQNPHDIDMQPNVSWPSLGLESVVKGQLVSVDKGQLNSLGFRSELDKKMTMLSFVVGIIFRKRVSYAFRNIKYKPIRANCLKRRLVQVFLGLIRRCQYNRKFQGFCTIKQFYTNQQNQTIQQLNDILRRARVSAAKILCTFLRYKYRTNIEQGFKRMIMFSKHKGLTRNQVLRNAFRKWIKIKNKVLKGYFSRIRSSRYLIERKFKVISIVKIIGQLRQRSFETALRKLRRNLFKQRQRSIHSQIRQIQGRVTTDGDDQLQCLKYKQQQLKESLVQVHKQKQQISQAYQIQVKQVQTKHAQINNRIDQLKQENQSLLSEIKMIDGKLGQEYTLDQIFKMFYDNLLLYVTKNKERTLLKSQMLDAITRPLVPVEIPLGKLRQQTRVLKDLLSQYVLLFGHKGIEAKTFQIPYQYLVKQNEVIYKMLLSLLPRLKYNKNQVTQLKYTLQQVQSVVKQFQNKLFQN